VLVLYLGLTHGRGLCHCLSLFHGLHLGLCHILGHGHGRGPDGLSHGLCLRFARYFVTYDIKV
jgi:hypothetical protein